MTNVTLEYIWLDGTEPTPLLRSKTKILETENGWPLGKPVDGVCPYPPPLLKDWGFDGSSTNQAEGRNSDCILKPVRDVPNPLFQGISGTIHLLVLCEVYNPDGTPHKSNTRAGLVKTEEKYKAEKYLFGFEQEYTLLKKGHPLGFPKDLTLEPAPQGPYYCGVGAENAFGRELVVEHMQACLYAGLAICGTNGEVMPGQWEFQIGAKDALTTADHLILARWLLCRLGEQHKIAVSRSAKPRLGDWNGAGCHTNISNAGMRGEVDGIEPMQVIADACTSLGAGDRCALHIANYGDGIEHRLTGEHETCRYDQFKFGVADRGASIRIPAHVQEQGKGYIEDRRPNANCDPYTVARLLMETIQGESIF